MVALDKDLALFAEYGVAWRANNALSLNVFGLQCSRKLAKNTFPGIVDRLETRDKRLLVPRVVLQENSKRHGARIIREWSELEELDRLGKASVRIRGLTRCGNAITDYFLIVWASETMLKLASEHTELPPPQVLNLPGGISIRTGGNSPEHRRSIGESYGEYLAERAAECEIIIDGLKVRPAPPRSILIDHAESLAYVPMTEQEIADLRDPPEPEDDYDLYG